MEIYDFMHKLKNKLSDGPPGAGRAAAIELDTSFIFSQRDQHTNNLDDLQKFYRTEDKRRKDLQEAIEHQRVAHDKF